MSARLIGELTNWLLSPAAQALRLTPAERNVLFVVAERSHERTRLMLRHRADDIQLVERIALATGLGREQALKRAFQGLAKKGLEVRVPIKKGKDGRPVFTHEGHSMRFQLPHFPASVAIPERPAEPVDNSPGPVDNPPSEDPSDAPEDDERGSESSRLSARGGQNRAASEAERGSESSRPYPSNYLSRPSNYRDPSNGVRSHGAEEEAPGPILFGLDEKNDLDSAEGSTRYAAASKILRRLPDFGSLLLSQARAELPDADLKEIVVRAAHIATKGIPA